MGHTVAAQSRTPAQQHSRGSDRTYEQEAADDDTNAAINSMLQQWHTPRPRPRPRLRLLRRRTPSPCTVELSLSSTRWGLHSRQRQRQRQQTSVAGKCGRCPGSAGDICGSLLHSSRGLLLLCCAQTVFSVFAGSSATAAGTPAVHTHSRSPLSDSTPILLRLYRCRRFFSTTPVPIPSAHVHVHVYVYVYVYIDIDPTSIRHLCLSTARIARTRFAPSFLI